MNTIALHSGASLPSPTMRRVGFGASALAVLFLVADAASELLVIPPVLAGAAEIGFPTAAILWQILGAVLLAATLLYAVPRTALLGAIVITGYLGGAICAHVRLGEDIVAPTVVSLVVAALTWGGLALRDARLRGMLAGD